MLNTITITAMNRPNYFQTLVQSLCANDISGWKIEIALEPSDQVREFYHICEEHLPKDSYNIVVNDKILGARRNPYELLKRVFSNGSGTNLYLEEDLTLSPDVLDIANWYSNNYRQGWLLMNLLAGPCGSAGFLSSPWFPDAIYESRTFNSLGFVVTRDKWDNFIEPIWMGGGDETKLDHAYWRTHWGWDWSVYALLASTPELKVLQPALARVNHIGDQGVNVSPELNKRYFGKLEINKLRRSRYALTPVDEFPHEVRSHILALDEITEKHLQLEYFSAELLRLKNEFGRR